MRARSDETLTARCSTGTPPEVRQSGASGCQASLAQRVFDQNRPRAAMAPAAGVRGAIRLPCLDPRALTQRGCKHPKHHRSGARPGHCPRFGQMPAIFTASAPEPLHKHSILRSFLLLITLTPGPIAAGREVCPSPQRLVAPAAFHLRRPPSLQRHHQPSFPTQVPWRLHHLPPPLRRFSPSGRPTRRRRSPATGASPPMESKARTSWQASSHSRAAPKSTPRLA